MKGGDDDAMDVDGGEAPVKPKPKPKPKVEPTATPGTETPKQGTETPKPEAEKGPSEMDVD